MGMVSITLSDERTVLKVKVENVVLKKLSGKKNHCLERGVFKNKTDIFVCQSYTEKILLGFFFWRGGRRSWGIFFSLPRYTKTKK